MEEREPKYCETCGLDLEKDLRTYTDGHDLYTGRVKWRTVIPYVCPKYTNPFLSLDDPPHTYITRTSEDNDERSISP